MRWACPAGAVGEAYGADGFEIRKWPQAGRGGPEGDGSSRRASPGSTSVAWMLKGAISCSRDSVRASVAYLVAQYAVFEVFEGQEGVG
jgi:hypothetical protein